MEYGLDSMNWKVNAYNRNHRIDYSKDPIIKPDLQGEKWEKAIPILNMMEIRNKIKRNLK
jgi:hypothetical protein